SGLRTEHNSFWVNNHTGRDTLFRRPTGGKRSIGVVLRAALAIAAAATFARPASAVTINFDDIPGSGRRLVDGDRYAAQGVTISSPGGAGVFAIDSPGFAATPPTFICGTSNLSTVPCDRPIQFDFSTPQTFVSVFIVDNPAQNIGSFILEVFDSLNNLLDSITSNEDRTTYSFALPGISRLLFTPSAELEGIDTLEFRSTLATVPEPTSVMLFGAGLAALGVRRRCRHPQRANR